MSVFKIFYSWQSDIPKNRRFIRAFIDDAVNFINETDTIEAERDEATKGLTGSPNIIQSIYKKIESCDLFIADITTCFRGIDCEERMSPNPNVLLELGFAAKCLGWESVICFCNSDYGSSFPFDIAQNRITSFSLKNPRKSDSKRLAKIVFDNIKALQSKGPSIKNDQAFHVIGSYNPDTNKVEKEIIPKDLKNQPDYEENTERFIQQARIIVERVNSIVINKQESLSEIQSRYALSGLSQKHDLGINYKADKVTVPNVEIQKRLATQYLGIELTETFFDIGSLKKVYPEYLGGIKLIGTEQEKEKYNLLMELFDALEQIEVRDKYRKTFSGFVLFPLAIHNCSAITDRAIRVVLRIVVGKPVIPDKNLICEELRGQESILYNRFDDEELSIMEELLSVKEDGTIHFDDRYNPESGYNIPVINPPIVYGSRKRLGSDPYEYEKDMKNLIASPAGEGYYEFNISSLRPNETKWLDPLILLKPVDNEIRIKYSITSEKSSGTVSDELSWKQNPQE